MGNCISTGKIRPTDQFAVIVSENAFELCCIRTQRWIRCDWKTQRIDSSSGSVGSLVDEKLLQLLCFVRNHEKHKAIIPKIFNLFSGAAESKVSNYSIDYSVFLRACLHHKISDGLDPNGLRLILRLLHAGYQCDDLIRFSSTIVNAADYEKSSYFVGTVEKCQCDLVLFNKLFELTYFNKEFISWRLGEYIDSVSSHMAKYPDFNARALCSVIVYYVCNREIDKQKFREPIFRHLMQFSKVKSAQCLVLLWKVLDRALVNKAQAFEWIEELVMVSQVQSCLSIGVQIKLASLPEPISSIQPINFYPERYLIQLGCFLCKQIISIDSKFENSVGLQAGYLEIAKGLFVWFARREFLIAETESLPRLYVSNRSCKSSSTYGSALFFLTKSHIKKIEGCLQLFLKNKSEMEILNHFTSQQMLSLRLAESMKQILSEAECQGSLEKSIVLFNLLVLVTRVAPAPEKQFCFR